MLEFFRAGGFNMVVLTALGTVVVVTAVKFARDADAQRLSIIRALTWAIVFSALAGFAAGLSSTAVYVAGHEPPDPLPFLLMGLAESTANLILGGGIAVVTWILVAVGVRRMPHDR